MNYDVFCNLLKFSDGERESVLKIRGNIEAGTGDVPDFMLYGFQERFFSSALPCEVPERIKIVADETAANPALALYARILFSAFEDPFSPLPFDRLPALTGLLGENSGIFDYMLCMGTLGLVKKGYAACGVPEEYVDGVRLWINGTLGIYASAHNGVPGTDRRQMSWITHYIKGRLFRIGRLEFLMHDCPAWVPAVYIHKKSGRPAVFCRSF